MLIDRNDMSKPQQYVMDYIDGVKRGEIIASQDIHLAVDLVLRDLQRDDLVWDDTLMDYFPAFASVVHGIELYDAQLFYSSLILCVYKKLPKLNYKLEPMMDADGNPIYMTDAQGNVKLTAYYNEVFLLMARGAGKNKYAATLAHWILETNKSDGYDIHLVSNTKKQSKTTYNDIYNVLSKKNAYNWKDKYLVNKELITHYGTNSSVYAHAAGADTKDGMRIGLLIFDEIHAYKTDAEIRVMTSALGKDIDNQRVLYISTNGNVRGAVIDDKIEHAERVLRGELQVEGYLPLLYRIDDEDELHEPMMWRKAQPAIVHLPKVAAQMLKDYEDSKTDMGKKVEFLTKKLNYPPLKNNISVIDWELIKSCTEHGIDLWTALKGMDCIGAVDYADVRDFLGLGLLFLNRGRYYWLSHTIVNKIALDAVTYQAPIDRWIEDGLITVNTMASNSPDMIADWFVQMSEFFVIRGIAIDQVKFAHLKTALDDRGFEVYRARKGTKTHTELYPVLQQLFVDRLVHFATKDTMSRWYFNNVKLESDGVGNVRYEKIEPIYRKTDGFDAFIHALQYRHLLNDRHLPVTDEERAEYREKLEQDKQALEARRAVKPRTSRRL